jgi:hypothetical protein
LPACKRLLHPGSGSRRPAPGRPAGRERGRRTRSRPAPRCEGCGGPAASAPTRPARRRRPAPPGSTRTSGGPWRPGRR